MANTATVLFETSNTSIIATSVILLFSSSSQRWQTEKAEKLIHFSSKHIHMHTLCSSPKHHEDNRQQIMPTNQNTAISSNFRKRITRKQRKALSGIIQSSNQGIQRAQYGKTNSFNSLLRDTNSISVKSKWTMCFFWRYHKSLKSLL